MPAPIPADWPAIAALAAAGETLETLAERFGVNINTLKSRCRAGGWKTAAQAVQLQRIEAAATAGQMARKAAQGVEVVRDSLADDSKATRLSLSRGARKMAERLEYAAPDNAGDMLQVAKTAALVHQWGDGTPQGAVVVNIALLGCAAVGPEPPVIDLE